MVVMDSKSKLVCFAALVLLFFNAVSSADLLFQITADKYNLDPSEEATISIWAYIEDGVEGNGLNAWQLDMVVDNDGVVQVNANPNLIAPTPIDPGSGWSDPLNPDKTGNVYGLGVFTPGPTDSNTAVGDFDLLAQVTIEAIGTAGQQVTYELTDYTHTTGFWGSLRDDTLGPSYIYPDNVQFLPGNNVFTIVPEPTSLLIMAFITGLAFRNRRRTDSGK